MTDADEAWARVPPGTRSQLDQELAMLRGQIQLVDVVRQAHAMYGDSTRVATGFNGQLRALDHDRLSALCAVALLQLAEGGDR